MFVNLLTVVAVVLPLGTAPTPVVPGKAAAATVCSVYCDTRDPSLAKEETFPVAEKNVNGRRIVLHVSNVDAMAWGSIDNGTTGNAVWLDRTWTDGTSWDGLLGKASIPGTWTGTRTLMYNLADPANHKRGMIRACGDASGVVCTDWVHLKVCDAACDGSTGPTGDNQPVPATTLSGRRIAVHLDNRGMAWAELTAGRAGDEVWLDRSWDQGVSWPGGSSLGRRAVPTGATFTSTTLYATTDPRSKLYGGAVRACGRAVEGASGSCTAWARPVHSRPQNLADALMYSYNPDTAWWPSSWWNSAVAVTTVIDYLKQTGRTDYLWVVDRTFQVNKGVFPAGVKSSDPIEGNFISRAIDDVAWWGLAWVQAYDLTGQTKYRDMAVTIANYVHGYWDNTCGGGVWWDRERTYKNAVTNGLYIRLTAALHNRLPGDTTWLTRATTGWNWFKASGMINAQGLVNDGLNTSTCQSNGDTVWTYNQGLAVGGTLELYRATNNQEHLTASRQLADAAINSPTLSPNGVLREACEATSCDDNAKQFKGIFMRYLTDLAAATKSTTYRTYAQRQSDTIWQAGKDSLNRVGVSWTGQATNNPRDWRTQASALSAVLTP
ncbi:glycoside hydrolase family 76 protein [Kribbella sp. NBC_01245]|uniref:glycoside hydrolase family 76 protein n=1 Tax=Kribbella sp. NBC_01245 TaxID=2903578 RepID=UPI002E2C4131|nr:glycoside hydrolase family 76 protein [Kribbella sp. NBC_01245]